LPWREGGQSASQQVITFEMYWGTDHGPIGVRTCDTRCAHARDNAVSRAEMSRAAYFMPYDAAYVDGSHS